MKKETYKQNMYCDNCGHRFVKEFEKGQPCNRKWTCPRCECIEAKDVGKVKSYWDY